MVNSSDYVCSDIGTLLLPAINESFWLLPVRAFLYLLGLFWCFMGVAIIADVFMCSIETITNAKRRIKIYDNFSGETKEVAIKVWNGTVANLSLMALGSSAPEILLSIIETIGKGFKSGELGPGTIVGSAAFNLLVIIAVCITSVGIDTKRISEFKVFLTTSFFSIFAYLWLIIILIGITPDYVDMWEGIMTFLLFWILLTIAYLVDKDICSKKKIDISTEELQVTIDLKETPTQVNEATIRDILKTMSPEADISEEELSKIAVKNIMDALPHSRAWYRINATRSLTGHHKLDYELDANLDKKLQSAIGSQKHLGSHTSMRLIDQLSRGNTRAVVEFLTTKYAVLECDEKCIVRIVRRGNINSEVKIQVETMDGTAVKGEDYVAFNKSITIKSGQTDYLLEVIIVDDNIYEPDEMFFVKMSLPNVSEDLAVLGPKDTVQITIINDDEPGTFQFAHPSFLFKESCVTAGLEVVRTNGADGVIDIQWKTEAVTAVEGVDFLGAAGCLKFEHGQISKILEIDILDTQDKEKDCFFKVHLTETGAGAKIGQIATTIVTVVSDKDYADLIRRIMEAANKDLEAFRVDSDSYSDQFKAAMNVNGGEIDEAGPLDYIMHFLTFFWKVLFAFVPPCKYLGGYPTFVCSLAVIGVLTAIIGDMASIFGCLVGLKDSVTAITFVALGTSLPDLFASAQAAKKDPYADNSVGNVTGSNSVNVFLGLGLPWMIASIYWTVQGESFYVPAGDLTFSVLLYCICAASCITLLFMKRFIKYLGGGELGGPLSIRVPCSVFLIILWLMYIILSALNSYSIINAAI